MIMTKLGNSIWVDLTNVPPSYACSVTFHIDRLVAVDVSSGSERLPSEDFRIFILTQFGGGMAPSLAVQILPQHYDAITRLAKEYRSRS